MVTPHKPLGPNDPAHFTKESKILIVGGGPAGINFIFSKKKKKKKKIMIIINITQGVHMGHLLKKNGFLNFEILEETPDVGGKSKTIYREQDGRMIPHEMGTCFLHQGYKRIMNLLDTYEVTPYLKTGGEFYDSIIFFLSFQFSIFLINQIKIINFFFKKKECNIYAPKLRKEKGEDPTQPQFILDWMFSDVEKKVVNRSCWCLPDQFQILTVLDAIERYSKLHYSLFGEYEYTIPPRPDKSTMDKINMTFGEFVKKHQLDALVPIFTLGNAAQGYGLLETIPAYYGLWWNTPALLSALVERKPLTLMVQKGYLALWKAINEKDELPTTCNAKVVSINRNLDDKNKPVEVEAIVNGEPKTYECDFLIITSPLQPALELLKDCLEDEKKVFSVLKAASLVTSLVKGDICHDGERATTYLPERLTVQEQGRFYAERNSFKAIFPTDPQPTDYQVTVAYQYYEEFKEGREEEAKTQLMKDLHEFGYKQPEILEQYAFSYFPKFSQQYLNEMYPYKILEMQGKNKTWYAGSSACFESVEDVVAYNHLLFKLFLKIDSK